MEVFPTAEQLFPVRVQQIPAQRFPVQTGSWLNNATPALATVIGTNSNKNTGNVTEKKQLPPLTETQSKSKMKNKKDKTFVGLMHPKREVLKHPAGEELLK